MKIENFEINKKSKVFIIAELSANHNGNISTAIETIKAAKRAGADCIKLQTYTADSITLKIKGGDLSSMIAIASSCFTSPEITFLSLLFSDGIKVQPSF